MRRFLLPFLMLLAVPFAGAQVIGVQPTPLGIYQWNSTQTQFNPLTNTYALFPAQSTPQPVAFYGYNSSLHQWVPCDTVTASCPLFSNQVVNHWSCQPGLGDGQTAISAGTYLQTTCMNTTGSTVTLTGLSCFTDNNGSSTMNASGHALGALLTGAVTCSSSFAAGVQSGNISLGNGDYIQFTFVADGTSKQTTWVVKGTY